MDGWDEAPVYRANLGLQEEAEENVGSDISPNQAKSRLREFIRNYRERDIFVYRDQLLQKYRKRDNYLTVDMVHLNAYDPVLQDLLQKRPNAHLPLFEEAAKDALQQLIVEKDDDFVMPDIHVILKSDQLPIGMRQITASEVNRLIKVTIFAQTALALANTLVYCIALAHLDDRYQALLSARPRCDRKRRASPFGAGIAVTRRRWHARAHLAGSRCHACATVSSKMASHRAPSIPSRLYQINRFMWTSKHSSEKLLSPCPRPCPHTHAYICSIDCKKVRKWCRRAKCRAQSCCLPTGSLRTRSLQGRELACWAFRRFSTQGRGISRALRQCARPTFVWSASR